ncbi:amidohydrolase family protein [Thalassotalea atypica]|uniref:amidohydrolase family protein n=1 Tax=Thalassotalea atypica TaxID=2054316 RepID=UPI0025732DC8|nr:amidohydrolase family protein [Thalassotalea atypica]
MNKLLVTILLSCCLLSSCSQVTPKNVTMAIVAVPATQSFDVLTNGTLIGHMKVATNQSNISIDFDYKDNGRGPTLTEQILLDSNGFPVNWKIKGNSTFGNAIDESFEFSNDIATWTDATGSDQANLAKPKLYINQYGSPYSLFIFANVLLKAEEHRRRVLPAGELSIKVMEHISITKFDNANEILPLTSYAISGADLNPSYFILDENHHLFAYIHPSFAVVRDGYEAHDEKLRAMAAKYSAERYEKIQSEVAHQYNGPVRIRNVRIFDPVTLSLTEAVSVVVNGDKISAIESLKVATLPSETEIDGAGGTLVAGLYDMHGHMGAEDALLNIAAGVTSVRDMGNYLEVLGELIGKIESGILAGPRITRYGFIEGKSKFSSNSGTMVESETEAIAAVQRYSNLGFPAIKLYNSMNGDWAPAIAKEAHRLNMKVTGHVPAFSNANSMIAAGYDELTHINQVMLGWVLKPDEDTRTLLRFTAMKRFPDLNLHGEQVQFTISQMVEHGVAIDPTLAIHERGMTTRNGTTALGVTDYIAHMPAAVQRNAKVAWMKVSSSKEDKDYQLAYQKILETVKMMKDRGIQLLPGTDLGGGFELHRELELYQELGMSSAEVIKLGSTDMARYLGHDNLGSIEKNKLADFFLVPGDPTQDFKAIKAISMVSKGGVFYYPSEIYPKFGIKPFTAMPKITVAGIH